MLQEEPSFARTSLVTALLLTGLLPFLQGMGPCGGPPLNITITSPTNGTFSNAGSILVTGTINKNPTNHSVDVNGEPATLLPDKTWSVTVPISSTDVFNVLKATVTNTVNFKTKKDLINVIAGESVDENDLAPDAVAVRINESGLAGLQPFLDSQINLDLATLVPPGTLVIDDFCYQDSFLGCLGRVDATISGSPPPNISGFSFALDSQNNFIEVDPTLNDLFVRANVVAVTGIPFSCTVDITAATTTIQSDIALEPYAPDPSNVDAIQNGGVNVIFGGFGDTTNCSGFLGGIVEFFIGVFIGDFQGIMQPALEDFLNTPDGNGNTPIAGALESALNAIEITGPIGDLIGADLDAPLSAILEDTTGATIALDTKNIATCTPPPGAPDLTRSLSYNSVFPIMGANTPVGGIPYGIGVCLSATAFNQLAKLLAECGLINQSITDLDLGGGTIALTAGTLAFLIPELGTLEPSTPMRLDVAPALGPAITDQGGPGGELVALKLGDLRVLLVAQFGALPGENDELMVEVTVNTTVGVYVSIAPNPETGDDELGLSAGTVASLEVEILQNAINTNELALQSILEALLPLFLPSLLDELGQFPIPSFAGLQINVTETSRNGEFISLFGDLTPAP